MNKRTVFILTSLVTISILAIVLVQLNKSREDRRSEQIIWQYFLDKKMVVIPYTEKYYQFLKGILLSEHPELINPPSKYVKNDTERDNLIFYAIKTFNDAHPEYYDPGAVDIPEAPTVMPTKSN
jgi:hypothetical protein